MNSVATNSSIIILSIIGLHPPFLTNFFSTRVLGVGFYALPYKAQIELYSKIILLINGYYYI